MSDSNYREMYLSEASEHVDIMNKTLLKLEEDPKVRENLDLVFRSAHTLKGMAATMGYNQTKELCMHIENVFDKIRKKKSTLTPDLASALFKCFDVLQQMVEDESKKIDLDHYLQMLENPEKTNKTDNSESVIVNQLPTIRVKMSDLDSLVNLVGELLISKMKLEKTLDHNISTKSQNELMELGRLVSELQFQSMKLRLVPLDTIFSRFNRIVRDTANKLGKKVQLHMEGSKIEIDRTVLDAITEPLLHILRNCVDHGIESVSERTAKGKPETGNISLTSFHAGEQIAIRIEDDGKGIDIENVKSKAVENGIISQEEANEMSDDKAIDLIGSPGLSTSKEITEISGRGVGMDVVINQVRGVGGNVQITTKKDQGTTMILSLPLSISIIGGLLVNISNEKYVLPLSRIITTVKIGKDQIKSVHGTEVIEFQNNIVPLVQVAKTLGLDKKESSNSTESTIVIVDKSGKQYGLVVDSLERKQDIVIKKFSTGESFDAFTNATILPDGKVALILDPTLLI